MISRPEKPLDSHVPAIEIEVVSLDWKWLFIYPQQGVASVNQLVVPVGTPVHFRLTSASVMNSFFVPQLAGQIYTMSGMTTQLNLLADQPGKYQGLSSQFSGDGFSGMRFTLEAVPAAQFEAWLSKARAGGGASTPPAMPRWPGRANMSPRRPMPPSIPACSSGSSIGNRRVLLPVPRSLIPSPSSRPRRQQQRSLSNVRQTDPGRPFPWPNRSLCSPRWW